MYDGLLHSCVFYSSLKSNLTVNLIIVLILIYYLISLIDDKFKLDPSPSGKGSDIKHRSPPP
jgi:UDP-N-acetylmuramyl pentapeptide phosphotransferase/UDP-N-acetylglucosamine-1-phosphate transferase